MPRLARYRRPRRPGKRLYPRRPRERVPLGPGAGDNGEGRILRYVALVEAGRFPRALAEVARVGKGSTRNLAIVAWGALALLDAELEAEQ